MLQQQLVLTTKQKTLLATSCPCFSATKSEELLFLCHLRLLWKEPNSWNWKSNQIKDIIGQKRPEEQTGRYWLATSLSSPGSKNIQNRDPVYSLHCHRTGCLSTYSLCMCVSKHTPSPVRHTSSTKTRALFSNCWAISNSDFSCHLFFCLFLILQIM